MNNQLFSSNSVSNTSISSYQMWAIYLDRTGTIWIESSDIGLNLLRKDPKGDFHLVSFGELNSDNINDIPIEVYNILPSSLRDKYNRNLETYN